MYLYLTYSINIKTCVYIKLINFEKFDQKFLASQFRHRLLLLLFYAPNFEEVEGAYWFGPVRPSVSPSVRNSLAV